MVGSISKSVLAFFLVSSIASSSANAQSEIQFDWDVVVDSLDGDRNQLFSKSKMFIAENWNSATHVIKNEDREAGLILLKGVSSISVSENLGFYEITHRFDYTVKMYHKDTRCRIVLECSKSSIATPGNVSDIKDITDTYQGMFAQNMSKKNYCSIQAELAQRMRQIVEKYKLYMITPSPADDDW